MSRSIRRNEKYDFCYSKQCRHNKSGKRIDSLSQRPPLQPNFHHIRITMNTETRPEQVTRLLVDWRGGDATSTALNLLVLPTLALRFGRFEATTEGNEI